MSPSHKVSRAAIELVKRFEGYRRKAAQLPDGRWTIGYGHTLTAREGAEVSEADAEALLIYDLLQVARTVRELTYAELSQNQFDALCAFAFSIGPEAFRASDVLKRVNEGAFTQAAFAMELWRKAEFEGERIVIDALVRRRAAEKLLFLTPPNGAWRPAPSAVLKPERDETAADTAPRGVPARIVTTLEGAAVSVMREPASDEAPETESPVRAAAEAVSARLQSLFADPDPAPQPAEGDQQGRAVIPEPEAEPPAHAPAEEIVPDPGLEAEMEALLEPAPPPEPAAEPSAAEPDDLAAPPPPQEDEPLPSIFREKPLPEHLAKRVMIDDTAPFEFTPPPVQPIHLDEGGGPFAIISLIVLGLAFFGGGIFWALAARPDPQPGFFTPQLVGWLAGVAGIVLVAAAVFLILQRVTRAAERR